MEIGWSGTVYFIFWDLFSCRTFIPFTPSPQCPRLTVVLRRPFVPSPRNGFMFDQSHCFLHPLRRLYRVFERHYLEFLWGEWRCKVHHVPPSADNQGGIGRASCLYVSYICCCWIFFFVLFLLNKYYMCLGGFFKHPWKHSLHGEPRQKDGFSHLQLPRRGQLRAGGGSSRSVSHKGWAGQRLWGGFVGIKCFWRGVGF